MEITQKKSQNYAPKSSTGVALGAVATPALNLLS